MRPRQRRGQALVEMAIACPILLAFLFGIVDLGWLYHHQIVLTNASREGARLGALGIADGDVRARVTAYLQTAGYTPMPAASDITAGTQADAYRVTLNSRVPCLFGMFGTEFPLKATAEMRKE